MNDIRRRTLLEAATAAGLITLGGPAHAQAMPHGLRPGRPFNGTEINVLVPAASQYRAHVKRLPEFERLTGIKANYSVTPYGQLRDKITTESIAGAGTLDVINFQDSWAPSLAQYIHPIDDYIRRDGLDMGRYPSAYRAGSTFEGKVLGLPVRGHPQLFFYRKDLYEQAGVQPPATWEELPDTLRRVQERAQNTAGIAMYYGKGNGGQNLFLWLNHVWGKGGDVLNADLSPRFNDAAGTEATQMYLDLLLRHRVAAPGSVQFVESDAVNSVAQGNSAGVMVWWWTWSVLTGAQSRLQREQVGFAPMPRMANGRPATYALSLPFGIAAGSRRKDACWEFLKWLSNPELEVSVVTDKSDPDTADIVTTHTANFTHPDVNRVNFGLHEQAVRSLEGSRIMPQLREWPQVAEVLENTISELATGGKTVRAGLDEAARNVANVLRRAGRRG
jgi:multiple sugar transport system substrate-binding protein